MLILHHFKQNMFQMCQAKCFTGILASCQNKLLLHACRRHIHTKSIVWQKHKRLAVKIEKKKNPHDSLATESVPLIVRLLNKKQQNESDQGPVEGMMENLSVEKVKKSLEDISWDAEAFRNRQLQDIELALQNEEEETEPDLKEETEPDLKEETEPDLKDNDISEMAFLEEIYFDDDLPRIQTFSRNTQKRHRIKGSPDPSIPKSEVPCSGCGAPLHCQDPIIPGYMPSEKFKCLTLEQMQTSICQRCFLIRVHNMFINVKVSAETYPTIMKEIKHTRSLVVVVIDLFDMKNSIFKDLLKYIGRNRPLFIVGNKVDILPKDNKGYMERIKQALMKVCESEGLNPTQKNIKHICLVSAKTGYGIEELITKLMSEWQLKGHVYVVGCTNVGKSTLFNALLMSDYCKSSARGLINRATVSVWPGTTMSLLKFPIINPAPWKLSMRIKRLQEAKAKFAEEETLRRSRLKASGNAKDATLMGYVGLTDFRSPEKIAEEEAEIERETVNQNIVSFVLDKDGYIQEASQNHQEVIGQKKPDYNPDIFKMYWTYDTPGVENPEQIINLLEPEELRLVLPKFLIQPRCLTIKPGQVLFITGLGRVDYVEGKTSIYLTVHCSNIIPLHVKESHEADRFYQETFGTSKLGVPIGDFERLLRIPALVGREFHVIGRAWDFSTADIQLSSLGWISVAAGQGMAVTLRAYTPAARGLHLRCPALLPHFTYFRGKRKGKTPFYHLAKPRS